MFIFFLWSVTLFILGALALVTDKNRIIVRTIKVQVIGLICGIKTFKLNFDIIIFYLKLKF